jgi:DNA-binding NarL/FixJ family response regulator
VNVDHDVEHDSDIPAVCHWERPNGACRKYSKENCAGVNDKEPMPNVLLCTDEPILAEGLENVLASVSGFHLCGHCRRADDLPAQVELHKPDVLLIDLNTEVHLGVLVRLQEVSFQSKIVLWVHSISTELALQSMSLGIRGILRKTLPVETLTRCLTLIGEGELWFDQALTDSLMTTQRYSLTRREGQLVTLLAQGMKNKEIATALQITEGTVKVYLSRLFQKLNVNDRFELALFGLKNLMHGPGSPLPHDASLSSQSPRSFFVERIPHHTPAPAPVGASLSR